MIEISKNKSRLDVAVIHQFLKTTYWAKGRTIEDVKKTIEHSLCFGIYKDEKQIGFARIVTDYTVFAYLMDLFVLPEYRAKGYSKQLMKAIIEEPKLQKCTTWMLKTSDTHGLYKHYGFSALQHSEKVMERILK